MAFFMLVCYFASRWGSVEVFLKKVDEADAEWRRHELAEAVGRLDLKEYDENVADAPWLTDSRPVWRYVCSFKPLKPEKWFPKKDVERLKLN